MDEFQTQNNNAYYNSKVNEIVSLKEWLITMLVLCIPLVNIVMVFVWAFGSNTNPSKANFFKAYLVFMLIGIVLWFLFFGAIVGGMIGSMNY